MAGALATALSYPVSAVTTLYSALWADASPDQRKLTTQLTRNSIYFAAAALAIRFLGDQLAV